MRRKDLLPLALIVVTGWLLASCAQRENGTLEIFANGEEFVRQGFVSKDGWKLVFDQVTVSLDEITAYQTDPAFDARGGAEIDAQIQVELDGPLTVDLAAGDADAGPILAGTIMDAPAGFYNALSWTMTQGDAGYPLVIAGSAEKDGEVVDFTIQFGTEYEYACGEYIGDERRGILVENGSAGLEMTFHFDHIFGDASIPRDDALNLGAPGFDPFAGAAKEGYLEIDNNGLREALTADEYQRVVDILPTLGHAGEGHCRSEAR